MKKVMAFGTFDIVHPGHRFFLKNAKKLGKYLVVVVARDLTVKEIKKKFPINNEQNRVKGVERTKVADKVILGNIGDKYSVIETEKPDVIAIGYDQNKFVPELAGELKKRRINAEIVKIPSYMPHKYKTSKLIKQKRIEQG